MENNRNNYNYYLIDLFKYFFSIIVISIHTQPLIHYGKNCLTEIYGMLCDLAVPFFFIISGFFIGKKLELNENNWKIIYKKSITQSVKHYILWSLIYFPLAVYEYYKKNIKFPRNMILYFKGFFVRGQNYNSWMLWFLLSLIYSLILICFLNYIKRSKKSIFLICFSIGVIGILISAAISGEIIVNGWLRKILDLYKMVFSDARILLGPYYTCVGINLYSFDEKFNNYKALIPVTICAIILYFYTDFEFIRNFSIMYLAFILCCLIVKANNIKAPSFRIIREMSKVNYYTHMLFYSFYTIVLSCESYGVSIFIYTYATCFIFGLAIIFFSHNLRNN